MESTHAPRVDGHPFEIGGDTLCNRFLLSAPIDGYGMPSIYLSLLRQHETKTHRVFVPYEGDQIGSSGSPLDPRLAALADNGGPTQTHAPRVGSPVINAGDNDQAVTGAGRRTQLEYDDHGRLTKRIDPDPDGIGPVEAPETTHTYDALGRRTQTTEPDPDGDGAQTAAATTYTYDHQSLG